jgi:hypothetical protein
LKKSVPTFKTIPYFLPVPTVKTYAVRKYLTKITSGLSQLPNLLNCSVSWNILLHPLLLREKTAQFWSLFNNQITEYNKENIALIFISIKHKYFQYMP